MCLWQSRFFYKFEKSLIYKDKWIYVFWKKGIIHLPAGYRTKFDINYFMLYLFEVINDFIKFTYLKKKIGKQKANKNLEIYMLLWFAQVNELKYFRDSLSEFWSLSDCNWTWTHNHLVYKRLSVRLWAKWLWVLVQLQSLKFQILRLLQARSSLTFGQP